MAVGVSRARFLFLLRAHQMPNQSHRLSRCWSLSWLRVAEVSGWVAKFSSFCKAQQHFPPTRLLPQIPRGNVQGRCSGTRGSGKRAPSARAQVETPARVGQLACGCDPRPQNKAARSLEPGPSSGREGGREEGKEEAQTRARRVGLGLGCEHKLRRGSRDPAGRGGRAPCAPHRRRGPGVGRGPARTPRGARDGGRRRAPNRKWAPHGSAWSPRPVACPAGGGSLPCGHGDAGLARGCFLTRVARSPASLFGPEPLKHAHAAVLRRPGRGGSAGVRWDARGSARAARGTAAGGRNARGVRRGSPGLRLGTPGSTPPRPALAVRFARSCAVDPR
ncbi:translation initiation factor IF-2-like [Phyllostomus hastatus]|uniref:translation initiation factor IF-2-like n=1 Tax=Phyllostomus hastatus TaxID=9423 RepID=UPI001E681D27|nr:translation initiation factor IF-2-like [Phyllostomus hastatus]